MWCGFASMMQRASLLSFTALPVVHSLRGNIEGETDVTDALNGYIRRDENGIYTGGKGLLLRNPFDTYEQADFHVLPTTFWSNDIFTPSQMYPGSGGGGGDPMCPKDGCSYDGKTFENGPWNYAQTAYVVGSQMHAFFADYDSLQSSDWGWGVFYPTDSNAVDKRCRYIGDDGSYDCPGGYIDSQGYFYSDTSARGAGYYDAGNPYANSNMGGGAGCHFNVWGIDQMDAWNFDGQNLVGNWDCECNYNLQGNDGSWEPWVTNWLANAQPKDGFDYQWFSQSKAPSWALDVAACWVNNLRDLINLQNQIYWNRFEWSAQEVPQSQWNPNDPQSNRPYWGWNEIPMPSEKITNPRNWDAVVIKLPAAICGDNGMYDNVGCLGQGQKKQLHDDLIKWRSAGHLVPGRDSISHRPGSYVVFAREWMDESGNWNRFFYCENFQHNTKGVKIVFEAKSDANPTGACYADNYGTLTV